MTLKNCNILQVGGRWMFRKWSLKLKLTILIGLLMFVVLCLLGLFSRSVILTVSKDQVGKRALALSETVANMTEVQNAFLAEHPELILQNIVQPIKEISGAQFIVIGNREEIRYTHPDSSKIGEKMIGEDNASALVNGESYVSEAVGSLGSSLRAKSPIVVEGEIVGVVSVGFLENEIQMMIQKYTKDLLFVLGLIAIFTIFIASMIAKYIKKLLYNLEPEEIAELYFQREKILQSAHEGILAVNPSGEITVCNEAAKTLLGDTLIHQKALVEVMPTLPIEAVLQKGSSLYNKEIRLNDHTFYMNLIPIFVEKQIIGAVATFRDKTEIEALSMELESVKQYSNALRAQTHEYSNKLHTLLGLLLLEKQDEAIRFIQEESILQQDTITTLIEQIADARLSGLLIAKIAVAKELKIAIEIEPESRLQTSFEDAERNALMTAIGNLMDNAIDEVKHVEEKEIRLYFTDIGEDSIFEIEDSGRGISDEGFAVLFNEGYSTKKQHGRGFGLSNVKNALEAVQGHISIEEGDLGGATFIVSIPKKGGK